jgi:hypothetical protein
MEVGVRLLVCSTGKSNYGIQRSVGKVKKTKMFLMVFIFQLIATNLLANETSQDVLIVNLSRYLDKDSFKKYSPDKDFKIMFDERIMEKDESFSYYFHYEHTLTAIYEHFLNSLSKEPFYNGAVINEEQFIPIFIAVKQKRKISLSEFIDKYSKYGIKIKQMGKSYRLEYYKISYNPFLVTNYDDMVKTLNKDSIIYKVSEKQEKDFKRFYMIVQDKYRRGLKYNVVILIISLAIVFMIITKSLFLIPRYGYYKGD